MVAAPAGAATFEPRGTRGSNLKGVLLGRGGAGWGIDRQGRGLGDGAAGASAAPNRGLISLRSIRGLISLRSIRECGRAWPRAEWQAPRSLAFAHSSPVGGLSQGWWDLRHTLGTHRAPHVGASLAAF
ncbi:MAG: hypothetical protein ACK52I_13090 [Pseudomonadota bacterium]